MEKQRKLALTEEEKSVNIVDVFMYLIAHWKWYFLSILLFGGCFWYFYCKTPFVYSRVAIVMIKTPTNSRSGSNDFMGQINVASEILQFKSKELMRKVIDRLQANVSYMVSVYVPGNYIQKLPYAWLLWMQYRVKGVFCL